ncbi:MAG TPA: SET domain-containing protein-lysine N-methyltransferase [Dehalococcoidia bacterium]
MRAESTTSIAGVTGASVPRRAAGKKIAVAAAPATRGPLFEVRDSPIHGRGVFAARPIRAARRIIEYRGERISNAEAFDRYGESIEHTFLFSISRNTVIDPSRKGNAARFINHSCDPNCESFQDEDRIFIEAIRDIAPGEELSYDYKLIPSDDESDPTQYRCRCGAERCRGTLLAPPKRARAASKNGRAAKKAKR